MTSYRCSKSLGSSKYATLLEKKLGRNVWIYSQVFFSVTTIWLQTVSECMQLGKSSDFANSADKSLNHSSFHFD